MRMVWDLEPAPGGTRVIFLAEDVPEGISKEDHDAGLKSSLENLAAYVMGARGQLRRTSPASVRAAAAVLRHPACA